MEQENVSKAQTVSEIRENIDADYLAIMIDI